MNTSKKFYLIVVMLLTFALALAACGDSATSTSAPVPTKAPTTTAAATTAVATTAAPTTAAATTAAATIAPTTAAATTAAPKPTTAAATTAAATGGNTISGLGISLTFPAGWATTIDDKTEQGALGGTSPDGSYISIYRYTTGAPVQGDLKTRSATLLDTFKTNLSDFKVLEQPTQVSDDTVRFSIEYTDKKSSTLNTEIVLVIDDAALKATYLVEAGAPKTKFQSVSNTLVSILNTIKTNPTAATAATTAAATGQTGTVKGLGINLTFPADWQANVNDKDDGGSITSLNTQRSYINIFRFTTGTLVQGELKDRTAAVLNYLKSVYSDLQVIEEPTVVSADTSRFSIQFTDKTTKTPNLELVLVIDDTTLKGTYLVEAGSEKSKFDSQKDALLAILGTIKNA